MKRLVAVCPHCRSHNAIRQFTVIETRIAYFLPGFGLVVDPDGERYTVVFQCGTCGRRSHAADIERASGQEGRPA